MIEGIYTVIEIWKIVINVSDQGLEHIQVLMLGDYVEIQTETKRSAYDVYY